MGWLRSHLTCLAIYAFFAASVAPLDARRSLRANAECADADVLTAAQAQAVDALPPGASLLFGEVWGPSSMKKFGKTDVARAEFQAEVIGVQIGELGKVRINPRRRRVAVQPRGAPLSSDQARSAPARRHPCFVARAPCPPMQG